MFLVEALGLEPRLEARRGLVVALVGAGGKTSLLFALAREIAGRWGAGRVAVTTTTRILEPSPADLPPLHRPQAVLGLSGPRPVPYLHLASSSREARVALTLERPPDDPRLLVIGAGLEGAGGREGGSRRKVVGLPAEWVDELSRTVPGLALLVEADGSAGRPLKAPAAHEPVVPASTDLVIAVAGVDAVGLPLDADHVHRPEEVARLTGLDVGERIRAEDVATVLQGSDWRRLPVQRGLSPADSGPPMAYALNRVDTPSAVGIAREVVSHLYACEPTSIVLTCCLRWPVVAEPCGPAIGH